MDKTLTSLLIVSGISLLSFIFLFFKMKPGFGPFNLKVYGLNLIIILSVIIIFSDVPKENLSLPYSLLGACAGYLFGIKSEKKKENKKADNI